MNHVETVQSIYQAFGAGDIPAIFAVLADDIAWEHDLPDYGVPWLTPGKGLGAVEAFFGVVGREFEFKQFEVSNLLAGGDQVAGVLRVEATIRSTGKTFRDLEIHLWTFNEEGKVSGFRHLVDTFQHIQAAQP